MPPAAPGSVMRDDALRYRIVPIGSGPTCWAIERDGKSHMTGPRVEVLGAWLDAILAGASEHDSDDLAAVIAARPRPSYDERLTVSGRPDARSLHAILSQRLRAVTTRN